MNSIRVVEDEMSITFPELDACHQRQWNAIKEIFQAVNVRQALRQRSESLKNEIATGMSGNSELSWGKFSIFHNPRFLDVAAIYRLDGRGICSRSCGNLHKVNIVLCLNNRETIGTNFLKLEVAAQEDIRHNKGSEIFNRNILGILITANEGLLKAGNWDSSYASADEYTFAFKHAYRELIKSNVIGMQLNII